MNVLFVTNNRTLGGTIRILQSWLLLAPSHGIQASVVIPTGKGSSLVFVGGLFEEATILEIAKAYQDRTGFHKEKPPAFVL